MELKEPVEVIITTTLIFHKEEPKPNEWGSGTISYQIYYSSKDGIMQIWDVGAFGDRTLVKKVWDKRGRGITLEEMLENIQELSQMPYEKFLELIKE